MQHLLLQTDGQRRFGCCRSSTILYGSHSAEGRSLAGLRKESGTRFFGLWEIIDQAWRVAKSIGGVVAFACGS